MPKITVITPSIRPKGIALVEKALKRQTFKDFEHIIQGREGKMEGNRWTLNQDYNIAIRKAKGELIISWQDFTYAQPDTLERFWNHYQQEPKTLVGAVGNKYEDESWTIVNWQDPRERQDQGTYYEVFPSDVEWNLCACPKDALYAVGGFDEAMDIKFGMDGYSVNDRLDIIGGWNFKLDQAIKSYSLGHGRPDKWDEYNWNGPPYVEYRERYVENPKLNYLQ